MTMKGAYLNQSMKRKQGGVDTIQLTKPVNGLMAGTKLDVIKRNRGQGTVLARSIPGGTQVVVNQSSFVFVHK